MLSVIIVGISVSPPLIIIIGTKVAVAVATTVIEAIIINFILWILKNDGEIGGSITSINISLLLIILLLFKIDLMFDFDQLYYLYI